MKTASVRDLRQNFPRVLAWIEAGEDVAVTMRRKVVARLVPEPAMSVKKPKTPDFASFQKRIFGPHPRIHRKSITELDREETY